MVDLGDSRCVNGGNINRNDDVGDGVVIGDGDICVALVEVV